MGTLTRLDPTTICLPDVNAHRFRRPPKYATEAERQAARAEQYQRGVAKDKALREATPTTWACCGSRLALASCPRCGTTAPTLTRVDLGREKPGTTKGERE